MQYRIGVRVRDSQGHLAEGETFLTVSDPGSGPVRVLSGPQPTSTNFYTSGILPGTLFDARTATWDGEWRLLVKLAGGPGITWDGGVFSGYFPDQSWVRMHDAYTFVADNAPRLTIRRVRAHETGDGFSINAGCDDWLVQGSHFSRCHDDALQNDFGCAGMIDDCLFDGIYSGYSSRPHKLVPDNSAKIVTIQNTLMRLEAMPDTFHTGIPGHAMFFKMDNPAQSGWSDIGHNRDPKLRLLNNVYRVDQRHEVRTDFMIPPPDRCEVVENNILVWGGLGAFPYPIYPGWTVTTNLNVWNTARAAWLANHPQVAEELP